jgi:NAD-dependent dihydropyrimidine dehydrogenase PreA subunit
MAFVPVVDEEKCKGCEECVDNCTAGVLEMREGVAYVARSEDCQGCENCVQVCDYDAIKVIKDNRQALSPTLASLFKDLPE